MRARDSVHPIRGNGDRAFSDLERTIPTYHSEKDGSNFAAGSGRIVCAEGVRMGRRVDTVLTIHRASFVIRLREIQKWPIERASLDERMR